MLCAKYLKDQLFFNILANDLCLTWYLCDTTRLDSYCMTESYGSSISSLSADVGLPFGLLGSSSLRGMDAI